MISVNQALEHMRAAVQPVNDTETINVTDAVDRVLATPVYSPLDIPGYDNSAMDGYAFIAADSEQAPELTLAGKAMAGHPYTGDVKPGECIRIMTGAQVPACVDTVTAQENTEVTGQAVRLLKPVTKGSNIRRRGEELQQNQQVFAAGYRINPVDIGVLSSLGFSTVKVQRRLKVALFSTGDELVPPGGELKAGQLYDSNRYVIKAMLQRLAVDIIDLGLIPDDPAAVKQAFETASTDADAILCSGGVSVGDADYTKQVLDSYGSVGFWKVAMKPGKPFAFGRVNNAWFFGLPGNPVSAVVTFHQLALPTLMTLGGQPPQEPLFVYLKAGERLRKRPGRADYQRAVVRHQDGESRVFSTGPQGSAMLTSLSQGSCYVVLEAERGTIEAGELVKVMPITSPLR